MREARVVFVGLGSLLWEDLELARRDAFFSVATGFLLSRDGEAVGMPFSTDFVNARPLLLLSARLDDESMVDAFLL